MAQRFKTRARERRESEILLASEDRLATRGCVQFSVDEVAEKVGTSRGTIYQHFPNRTALIARTLDGVAERCCAALEQQLRAHREHDVIAAIGGYAKIAAELSNHHATVTGRRQLPYPCCLCLLSCPFWEHDALTPAVAEAFDRARDGGAFSAASWDGPMVSRWVRVMLADPFSRVHSTAPSEIEAEIDLAVQLLERGLGPAAAQDR